MEHTYADEAGQHAGPSARNLNEDSPRLLVKIWLVLLPITSVLVLPGIQGTTPSNLLALTCVLPIIHGYFVKSVDSAFARRLFLCSFVLALSLALSQFALLLSDISALDLYSVPLASATQGLYLRSSLITQSLYLLTSFIVYCFFWTYYDQSWDSWLLAGAVLLAAYGFLEISINLATGGNGDFLSNRTFNEGKLLGSLTQLHSVFGFPMMRLKSLTGEPSMYAITILPYAALAIFRQRWLISATLLVSLFLSLSTTAYLGMALILAIAFMAFAQRRRFAIAVELYLLVSAASLLILIFHQEISLFFEQTIITKLLGQGHSGEQRQAVFDMTMALWNGGSTLTKLFGIGFGNVRSTDLFSTLLVNIGAIGLLAWCALFIYPALASSNTDTNNRFFAYSAIISLALMMLAVPEFAYPAPWAFLGIAYNYLTPRKRQPVAYGQTTARTGNEHGLA